MSFGSCLPPADEEAFSYSQHINDGMGKFIAEQTVKQIIQCGGQVKRARVNILGLTFKENCADLRNTRVVDIIHELESYGIEVFVHDPVADPEEAMHEYGVKLLSWEEPARVKVVVARLKRPSAEYGHRP